jgi:hypothetical protein
MDRTSWDVGLCSTTRAEQNEVRNRFRKLLHSTRHAVGQRGGAKIASVVGDPTVRVPKSSYTPRNPYIKE